MKSYFTCLIWALLAAVQFSQSASTADEKKSYKDYKLHLVEGDVSDINKLLEEIDTTTNAVDALIMYSGSTDQSYYFLVPPDYKTKFEGFFAGKQLKDTITVDDYPAHIKKEQAPPGSTFTWTAYYDIDQIFAYLHNVSQQHRNIAKTVNAGRSYEGRDILGLRINTDEKKEKPAFYIESGIHAREWIAPAAATYFINQLLTSKNSKISAIRDQFDWHIFPCINPDGYHYSYTVDRFWRKNRSKSPNGCHGIDLNRNWDTENWRKFSASSDPCNITYAGPKPFSEPETLSMSQYVSKITNLQAFVTMHSDTQKILMPYSGSDKRVDNYDDLVKIGTASINSSDSVVPADEALFTGPAPSGEISYKSSGESMDWAKRTLKVPIAFTYELRGQVFDWPPSRIHEQGDEFTQMMLGLVTEAKKLGYFGKTPKTTLAKNPKTPPAKNPKISSA